VSDEALWADKARLRAANAALWAAWAAAAQPCEATQRAGTATGAAMGLRLGQRMTLLAIFRPGGRAPSRATVGRWVAQARPQARSLLAVGAQRCQRFVLLRCLDAIFFHREPILLAVEPQRLPWVAGQRGPDRSGASWQHLLVAWPGVERGITDAGPGLERGVQLVNAARPTTAQPSAMGRDVLHTPHARQRVRHGPWRRAERLGETAAPADAKGKPSTQRGREARGVAPQAWRAWRHAERVVDEAVLAEAAAAQRTVARGLLRPEGSLNDRPGAPGPLHAALEQLAGPAWGKTRRLRRDQRTLASLDWVPEQLAQAVEDTLWRDTVVRLGSLRQAQAQDHPHVHLAKLVMREQVGCQRLWAQWGGA
jgi:hypothetical protein